MDTGIQPSIHRKRNFFSSSQTKDIDFRLSALKRLKQAIRDSEDSIMTALADDLAKPAFEAFASEILFTIKEIDHHMKNLRSWTKPVRVRQNLLTFPSRSWITCEPYGVVLIIGPWNYPFQLVMCPLVSAIAAGNCAVVKPSELSEASSRVIRRIIRSSCNENHVSVIEGGADTAQKLLHEKFDYIFYTGSAAVGKIVMQNASRHLTPVTLELGGKSPCIVDRDTDLDRTVKRIALGKFFNAGQTCVAPDYVYTHKDIQKAFVSKLAGTIKMFYGDNPPESPDYPKIINRRHYDRLRGMINGEALTIGSHNREAAKIAPTIISNPSWESACMSEEIFGPVLPVIGYDDAADVISQINAHAKPLALYIFSDSRALQEKILSETSSGGVCINDTMAHILNPHLPLGGVGDSGMGNYHGKHGFMTFSHKKSVLRKKKWPDIFTRYPPYGTSLQKIKKFLY